MDQYIEKHDLERLTKEMLKALVEVKPSDPLAFMLSGLYSIKRFSSAFDSLSSLDYYSMFVSSSVTDSSSIYHEQRDSFVDSKPSRPSAEFKSTRRTSVSAESYQPSEVDPSHHIVIPKSKDSIERIEQAISKNLLFKNLDSLQKSRIIDSMFERKVISGEVIIKEGDEGDNFYVVDSGKFSIQIKEKGEVMQVGSGGTFGELALMYNTPRSASVIALSDGYLWAVDRITFRKIIIDISFRKRKMYEGFLRNVPILSTLEREDVCKIADALEPAKFQPDTVIIRQGDPGDAFFIIVNGTASVFVDGEQVNSLGPGDYFGELALLNNSPRAATIKAQTAVECLVLEAASFNRLLGPLDEILKHNQGKYCHSSSPVNT